MSKRSLLSWSGAVLLLMASLSQAYADKRVAFVVGNGAYRHATSLPNPPLDARAMRDMLKRLGFEVVYGEDLDRRQIGQAIARFADLAREADVALTYYAGHGATFGEIPYLVPVDAEFKSLAAMPYELVPLEGLLGELRQAKGIRLAMIDACRDNEAERDLKRLAQRGGSISRGLGRVQSPEGLIIAFATQYGMTAADGPANSNSPFTSAVLKLMPTPGLDVKTMFLDVGREVLQTTKGTQRPAIEISLYDAYALVAPVAPAPVRPPDPTTMAAATPPAATPAVTPSAAPIALPSAPPRPVAAPSAPESVAPEPAPPAPRPVAVLQPDLPAPTRHEPAWTASLADIAGWRLKATTRLGGALSRSAASLDRSLIAATADRDGILHVLDAATLKPRAKITLQDFNPYTLGGIAILPDGEQVVAVRGGALEIYDIASRRLAQTIPALVNRGTGSVTISKDGRHLYHVRSGAALRSSVVVRYRIEGKDLVLDTEFPFDERVDSFDVSADGRRFLLGMPPTNRLVHYDVEERQNIWSVTCSCSARFGVQDGLVAFAGRADGDAGDFGKPTIIGVLDTADPARRAIYRTGHEESLEVTDISPDGRFAAIGATNNGQVVLIPITLDRPELRPVTILKDRSGQNIGGADFVGRDALVTISGDNNARLWRR